MKIRENFVCLFVDALLTIKLERVHHMRLVASFGLRIHDIVVLN